MLMYIFMCVGKTESISADITYLKYCHVLCSADTQQCFPIDLEH